MPNISIYVDEDFYIPLKIQAEKQGKDLYRFVMDVLKEACEETRTGSSVRSRSFGWVLVDGSHMEKG